MKYITLILLSLALSACNDKPKKEPVPCFDIYTGAQVECPSHKDVHQVEDTKEEP